MNRQRRVVVVGGGVIGLATAYFLRQHGLEVVLIERDKVGNGASLGNAGWVVPSLSAPLPGPGVWRHALEALAKPTSPLFIAPRPSPAFALWLWRFWRSCRAGIHRAGFEATARLNAQTLELYDALQADGVRFAMWQQGLVFAFLEEANAYKELAHLRLLRDYGYEVPDDPLDGAALRALEPALSDHVRAGFYLKKERHVDPATVTIGLATRLREQGAIIHEGVEAIGFDRRDARVTGVCTTLGRIEADDVVLAAGAWSKRLSRDLDLHIPLEAGKGYSFHIRPAQPTRHPLYLHDARIGITPLAEGRIRVAGTMELSGLNLHLDARRIDAMISQARPFLADWPTAPIEDAWVGMRPLSPDGLPIIGRPEGFENLYLATGHSMLGVTLAPATGANLAALVVSGKTPPVLRPFSPTRFRPAWRRFDSKPSSERDVDVSDPPPNTGIRI